jgi:hypothetical protein
MKTELILDSQNNHLAQVYSFLQPNKNLSPDTWIAKLVGKIRSIDPNLAGFNSPKNLQNHLQFSLLNESNYNLNSSSINHSQTIRILRNTLPILSQVLFIKPLTVYLFPSFNSFVANQMGGTSGFSPSQNTLFIEINPNTNNWSQNLPQTLAHEYHHAMVYNFHPWQTLLDTLIFEGLAEHFREHILHSPRSSWTTAVNYSQVLEYLPKILPKLHSTNPEDEREVFFQGQTYPLWLGYSLGYFLTKDFVQQHLHQGWYAITQTAPDTIFHSNNFI